jgi:hypothetical protein
VVDLAQVQLALDVHAQDDGGQHEKGVERSRRDFPELRAHQQHAQVETQQDDGGQEHPVDDFRDR